MVFRVMNKLVPFLLIGCVVLWHAGVSAEEADPSEKAAQVLVNLLEPMKSLAAQFQQTTLDGSGARLQETRGDFKLKRPGLFRWQVIEPESQLVVSDGQQVYVYDIDLEVVTVQPLDQRLSHTPALLLSGQAKEVSANFIIEHEVAEEVDYFYLKPRSADTLFEQLRLVFVDKQLREMHLEDSLGQQTSIGFSSMRINPLFSDDEFQFEIPEGVDVVEGQAG